MRDRTSAQRVLAIGSAVFLVGTVLGMAAAPSVAFAKAPLAKHLFKPSIPSPTFRASLPESPKYLRYLRPRRRQIGPILRYATTVQVGEANVVLRFKARLKRRSALKFEVLF